MPCVSFTGLIWLVALVSDMNFFVSLGGAVQDNVFFRWTKRLWTSARCGRERVGIPLLVPRLEEPFFWKNRSGGGRPLNSTRCMMVHAVLVEDRA
jgi:hypothetical protein